MTDKLSINAGDVRLDLALPRGSDQAGDLFIKLLGRRGRPHFSLFGEPNSCGRFTPHFTARGGRFRRTLFRIPPAVLSKEFGEANRRLTAKFESLLEHANLAELEASGWTLHWADFRVLRRWVRRAVRRRDLQFDSETATSLIGHILRRMVMPTELQHVAPSVDLEFVALRWDDGDQAPHIKVVRYFAEAGGGRWYCHPMDLGIAEDADALPAFIRTAFERARKCVEMFPRTEEKPEDERPPAWPMLVLGYYGQRLLALAVEESLASDRV